MTTNRFTPLSNLQANNADSSGLQEQKKRISTHDTNRTTKQHRICMKIPTIVGGRLTHSDNRKPTPAKKETAHVRGATLNKEHKVRILGDSHLRGTATKIDQYLNTKFEVCSWIKPGANTEELVNTLEKDFKCLGKKDVIVINGGTNDTGSKRNQTNKVLVKMAQFMQKHSNSNTIVVNIPHRYDMDRKSVTNLEIKVFNRKLNKMAKKHKLEISKDKTALMPTFKRKRELYKSHPGVTTRVIAVVSKMKYLGVMPDSKLDWFPHALYLENKVRHIRNNLARCSKAVWGISYSNLMIVYKHALLPVITHAAKAWHSWISKRAKNKLQQIQRSLLVFLTKAYRSVSLAHSRPSQG